MSDFPSVQQRAPLARFQAVHATGNGAAPVDAETDGPMLGEYLGALRRRYWLVLLAGALGLGLAAFAVSRTERLYTSKAVVQFVDERATPTGGLAGLAASLGGGGGSLASQVQVVRSRVVLGQVVDTLGLRLQRKTPGILRSTYQPTGVVDQVRISAQARPYEKLHLAFRDDGVRVAGPSGEVAARYGAPVEVDGVRFTVPARPDREEMDVWVISRDDAIDGLLENVRVFAREGTNVVDIFATGYDPIITARISNTAADLYRSFVSRRSRAQAQLRRRFIEDQLRTTEQLLAQTQTRLTDFRQREQLYSSKAKAQVEQGGQSELEMKRAQLEAERTMYLTLLDRLKHSSRRGVSEAIRTIAASPTAVENPVIAQLYEQLSKYEAARDSLTSGPWGNAGTNPDVQRLDSLIASTQVRVTGAAGSYVQSLDAQIHALDEIQGRVDARMQHLASTEPEEVRLMLQMESIGEAAKALRERYYTVGMAEAAELDQVTILDPALPGELAGSGPARSLILGLVFGLMVGGAGAVVVDRANRSIRRREELEHLLHVPNLAVIPSLGAGVDRRGQLRLPSRPRSPNGQGDLARVGTELVGVNRVHSVGAEAYRTLRTNLIFAPGLESLRSIVVTSPSGAEGKTTTAANLAIAFAQKGMRVLLVDCDLRRPRLHTLFGVPREPGLSQLLLGEVPAEQVIRSTSVERLCVLPAGPLPSVSATDLLDGGVVRSLNDALSADFDLVIIDTPPVLATSTAAILGTQVDGVLLVARAGQTDRDAARETLQQLSSVGAHVVGTVLNDPDGLLAQRAGYYEEGAVLT